MTPPLVPVTVVVAFYSRCGATETLALTAAVGAVNGRALIRMRRMADVNPAAALAQVSPACAVELRRMHKEYVPPTEADIAGADALILVGSDACHASSPAWAPLVTMLDTLAAKRALQGKVGAVVGSGQTASSFASLLAGHGFQMVAPGAGGPGDAASNLAQGRALGRLVAEISRARKSTAR